MPGVSESAVVSSIIPVQSGIFNKCSVFELEIITDPFAFDPVGFGPFVGIIPRLCHHAIFTERGGEIV